jgi:D-serine deaminase-like pyridoxal phosphate-dependent protein
VVSCPTPERAILDTGSKALSSDLASAPGFGAVVGHPEIVIAKLNEEHGICDLSQAPGTLAVGERVRILPNHACVVTNLFNAVHLVRGQRVLCAHPVDARGRVT